MTRPFPEFVNSYSLLTIGFPDCPCYLPRRKNRKRHVYRIKPLPSGFGPFGRPFLERRSKVLFRIGPNRLAPFRATRKRSMATPPIPAVLRSFSLPFFFGDPSFARYSFPDGRVCRRAARPPHLAPLFFSPVKSLVLKGGSSFLYPIRFS